MICMRYVMGPKFGLSRKAPPKPDPNPSGKADRKPDVFWDEEAVKLTAKPTPYDPATEVVPVQLLTFLVPSGTMDVEPTADGLVASAFQRTVTPLSTDPAGSDETIDIQLPDHDDEVSYGGFVVFAFAE